MALLARFDPPANVGDFRGDAALAAGWSAEQSGRFDAAIAAVRRELGGRTPAFYNPTRTDTGADAVAQDITWPAFPRALLLRHGTNKRRAFAEADQVAAPGSFRNHDEYLEWFVHRAGEKIVRIDFTCEGPEYWDFLARRAPRTLLALYRRHVDAAVPLADLIRPDGSYNRRNRWNTERGAMHLTHPANTLNAEIRLAADATVGRQRGGVVLTDADELIDCARFGEATRSSDPRIGASVNALARQGFAITLQNPVGLYIAAFDGAGITRPDGTPARNYLRIVRGRSGQGLRATYQVPASERSAGQPFVVGDLLVAGAALRFGGQIAERISVKLTGVATRAGSIDNPPLGCAAPPPPMVFGLSQPSVPLRIMPPIG